MVFIVCDWIVVDDYCGVVIDDGGWFMCCVYCFVVDVCYGFVVDVGFGSVVYYCVIVV